MCKIREFLHTPCVLGLARTACGQQPDPHRRGELLPDLAVWQCLLQFGDTRAGDLGVLDVEKCQGGQPLEVHEPRVGDVVAPTQIERLQIGKSLEVHQPRVRDLSVVEVECLQVGQPFEVRQPRITDLLVAAKESRCCGGQQRYRSVGNS